jgi:GMP synthase-like glutamine amidotransferase
MRILVIQNYDNTGLGQVGTALAEVGAEIDTRFAHKGDGLPSDAAGHDALVVLGGGQNALDDEGSPYIPDLLELMRDFERRDRAVLGICLGSQLLARAFGAQNIIGTAQEFGWHEVALTREGGTDPVLGGLPGRFPIFQWHDDTFSLPPGAVHLATNPAVANQAFRIGRAAYGIQFHFEADRPLVEDWNRAFRSWLEERNPEWIEGGHERAAARHGHAADAAGIAIARAWVAAI